MSDIVHDGGVLRGPPPDDGPARAQPALPPSVDGGQPALPLPNPPGGIEHAAYATELFARRATIEAAHEPVKPPTANRIPQRCSPDRRRGRAATLAQERDTYFLLRDDLAGNPADGFRLPPHQGKLPPAEAFTGSKITGVFLHTMRATANSKLAGLRNLFSRDPSAAHYRRLLPLITRPGAASRWEQDADFARLRVAGANPHQIQRRLELPPKLLAEAAERVLEANGTSLHRALDEGRLFETDYGALSDPRIQMAATRKGCVIAAPTCLFWADYGGNLIPLAIQLRPHTLGANPVFTPLDDRPAWMLARAHAQAADGHYHEGVWHLLATHLVSEVFVVVTHRQLHPDHPIAQLLEPHTWFNLAIDDKARGHLLGAQGPIDTAMAAGVAGVLDLARIEYSRWSFDEQKPMRDLERRGVDDPRILSFYPYREDTIDLWHAIRDWIRDLVEIWYRHDGDVAADYELAAWAAELADARGGAIPGFPATITTRDALIEVLAAVIHRMSVSHAAVNNGQFDNYGFVPNAPGQVKGPLPETVAHKGQGKSGMKAFWKAMPGQKEALAQIGMAWVLSEPTRINLFGAGDAAAFQPESSPESSAAVAAFRRRLGAISDRIQTRNANLAVPYTYLDPRNIPCSTEL